MQCVIHQDFTVTPKAGKISGVRRFKANLGTWPGDMKRAKGMIATERSKEPSQDQHGGS